MDNSDIALILAAVSSALSILTHLRLRSECCGRKSSLQIDTTPSPIKSSGETDGDNRRSYLGMETGNRS